MKLKENLTPKRLIDIGLFVMLSACLAMALYVNNVVSKSTADTMGKVNSIMTMTRADKAILFYSGASKTSPSKDNIQELLFSHSNPSIKRKGDLISNEDLLARFDRAEKSILAGTNDNNADIIGWLMAVQLEAFGDILKRDLQDKYRVAPALAFTNGFFVAGLLVLMFSCWLIGFGFGKRNRVDIPCDLRAWYKFRKLSLEWKKCTGASSDWALPVYQEILNMGFDAVPFILSDLKYEGGHWFHALEKLTGENPIADTDAGDVPKMTKAWLDWGKAKGLLIIDTI